MLRKRILGSPPHIVCWSNCRQTKSRSGVHSAMRNTLARLSHQTIFSIAALNRAFAKLPVNLNQRTSKKLPGTRTSAFAELDTPLLRPLPLTRISITCFKPAHYHAELDGCYSSLPHAPGGRGGGVAYHGEDARNL